MNAEIISLIGVLIALALLIILSYKGISLPIVAILSAALIYAVEYFLIPDSPGVMASLKDTFMGGFVAFTKGFFLLLFLSTIFAQVMGESGAADSIAQSIVRLIAKFPGKEKYLAIFAMVLITTILTGGGVSIFVVVFVLLPIAKSMFEKLDIPWHLFVCYAIGSGTITLGGLPGIPSITNIIPTQHLGTTPMAGVGLGLIGSFVMLLSGCLYTIYAVRKTQKAGEGFMPTGAAISEIQLKAAEYAQRVNPLIAFLPPIVVLLVLNLLKQSVEISMVAGIIVCYALFFKNVGNVSKFFLKTVGVATSTVALVVISTSAIVGFGAAASGTMGYRLAVQAMINMDISPIWKVVISVSVCAGLLGSSSGGLNVAMQNLAPEFLASGLNPQVIHRLSAVASTTFDSLPHASAIVVGLHALKLTHRQAYKHLFFVNCVPPLIAAIVMGLFALVGVV